MKRGAKYNRLTAIKQICGGKNPKWLFRCDCGIEKVMQSGSVRHGRNKSCGCLIRERMSKGLNQTKHGLTSSDGPPENRRLYVVWNSMKHRCYNKKSHSFKNYGGRGISVCGEWLNNPVAFVDWALNNGYEKGLSIDRIDNDAEYSPNNCRWVSAKKQARNRRNTVPRCKCCGQPL